MLVLFYFCRGELYKSFEFLQMKRTPHLTVLKVEKKEEKNPYLYITIIIIII